MEQSEPYRNLIEEARNCLENKLCNKEITIERYGFISKFLDFLEQFDGEYHLGDGIFIKLVDMQKVFE